MAARRRATKPETMVTTVELPRDLYQRAKIQAVLDRVTFRALVEHALREILARMEYPLRHLLDFFGAGAKAVAITTDRIQQYVATRQQAGAATVTINLELALLGRAFTLAARAKRLRARPFIPRLAADPSRVRQ